MPRLKRAMMKMAYAHPIVTGRFVDSASGYRYRTGEWPPLLDEFEGPFPAEYQSPDSGIPAAIEGPLFRIGLSRTTERTYKLLLIADHSIMDFRSATLCLNGIFDAYSGRGSSAEGGRSFGWWTGWEKEYFSGNRMTRHLQFWRRQLHVCGPLPECGFGDRPNGRYEGAVERIYDVSGTASLALDYYAKQLGLSGFALLSVLWKCAQYGTKVIIGAADDLEIAASYGAYPNRLTPQVQMSVGGFANSAVIVSRIEPKTTLRVLYYEEDRQYLLAAAHQALPHGYVVRALSPSLYGVRYGKPDRIPAYLNFDMPAAVADPLRPPDGLRIHGGVGLPPDPPRGGIRVIVKKVGEGWQLHARFRADLYSLGRVDLFSSVWSALLDWWPRNPDSPFSAAVQHAMRVLKA